MKFTPTDSTAVSPIQEWEARVSAWLLADDPHQNCIALARAVGALNVRPYCSCAPPTACTKLCCVPEDDDL